MGADLELVVGGRPIRFPAVWLRDNCPCPDCLAPGTGQKLKDVTDIPNGLAVRRWDDEAKDPSVAPPGFGHFEALLTALLEPGSLSSEACGRAR